MEFKGVNAPTTNSPAITERYTVSIGEISRARVGLLLARNEELKKLLPVIEHVSEDSYILREHAEAVVAGNLELIRSTLSGPNLRQMAVARQTVESGLAALETGAIAAAELRYEQQQVGMRAHQS